MSARQPLTTCIQDEYVLEVPGEQGTEEIAILQRSAGEHQFLAWHGITAVNRLWLWDIFWGVGEVNLVGLPGHGRVRPPSFEQCVRWTTNHFIDVGVATARRISRGAPMTLMGHSTGGLVALGVAMRAPDLVERLILISPVIWHDLHGIVGFWKQFIERPALMKTVMSLSLGPGQQSYPLFRASLRALISDAHSFYSDPIVHEVLRHGYPHYQHTTINAIMHTARVIGSADMRSDIAAQAPSVPTLIIHGGCDRIVPRAQSTWLQHHLPNADLHILPGAGHTSFGEQRCRFDQCVQAWANQHNSVLPFAQMK